jgi:dTDP-L-rhamnose 4-epimerase
MHVLLTGGAGFIGRHVHAELSARGHRVRVLDSLRPDVHGDDPVHPAGLQVGDVRCRADVDQALGGIDAVIHLAARVGLGVDVEDLPDYADTNVHGTGVLLAAMSAAGVDRLVLASSMVIYGEGRGRCETHGDVSPAPRRESQLRRREFEPSCPQCDRALAPALVGENTPPDPRNGYAVTKLAQEHLASAWARTASARVTALRYHNVYGPGMPRDTPYAGVAAIFLAALRRGEHPRVFEDGGQRRDFVHVRDVAVATVTALERPADQPFLALNVGSGRPRTVGEFAQALAAATGGPRPVVTGDYRLGDVRHITADSSRLRTLLDWTPSVPFTTGVAELARH